MSFRTESFGMPMDDTRPNSTESLPPESLPEDSPAPPLNQKFLDDQFPGLSEVQDRFERAQPAENYSMEAGPSMRPLPPLQKRAFHQRNPVTLAFTLLLVVIYGLTSYPNHFQRPTDLAVMLGGFYPPLVHQGEWWRYITATLLHGNPGHLFNNAAGLLIFGNLLEPVIGGPRLIGLYIVSALAGLGLSAIMLPQGVTFGASTIDYGLIGTYLALILMVRYRADRQAFFREFRGAILFVALFVGWNSLESTTVNVWGHIGGIIGGVLYALAIWQMRPRRN